MIITPRAIRAVYAMLRELPPFANWKLPPARKVTFVVMDLETHLGQQQKIGPRHTIYVSRARLSHLNKVVETVAHEMVHVYLDDRGVKVSHGTEFKKHKHQVAAAMGFDPLEL